MGCSCDLPPQYVPVVMLHQQAEVVKYGMIPSNPDKGTEPPKPKKKEMKFLNKDEVQRFLEVAKASEDRNFALF